MHDMYLIVSSDVSTLITIVRDVRVINTETGAYNYITSIQRMNYLTAPHTCKLVLFRCVEYFYDENF